MTVPLEPAEPKYPELVSLIRDSEKDLRQKSPDKSAAFTLYAKTLYDYLFRSWESVLAVNSVRTDSFFEVRHDYQNALYDERQKEGRDGWNAYFLDRILETVKKKPGRRIVVTVGVEHAFCLRTYLRKQRRIILLEAEKYLK